jgi:hypothetical protein
VLARQDINDMFADLGYGTSGDESKVTTTGEANKIVKTDSSGGITASDGLLVKNYNYTEMILNAGSGYHKVGLKRLGYNIDAKPCLILFAKKYVGTLLAKTGFEGKIYLNRGANGARNISGVIKVIITTAYNDAILNLETSGNVAPHIVETTYSGEQWYGIYIPVNSKYEVMTDGIYFSEPIFISDATGYPITYVNYSSQRIKNMLQIDNTTTILTDSTVALDVKNGAGTDVFRVDSLNKNIYKSINTYEIMNEKTGSSKFNLTKYLHYSSSISSKILELNATTINRIRMILKIRVFNYETADYGEFTVNSAGTIVHLAGKTSVLRGNLRLTETIIDDSNRKYELFIDGTGKTAEAVVDVTGYINQGYISDFTIIK